jgi:hypothetical protein
MQLLFKLSFFPAKIVIVEASRQKDTYKGDVAMIYTYSRLFNNIWGLLILGLAVWAAWWTYNDTTKSNNKLRWLWTIVSLLFFPLGFIIYLMVRVYTKPKNTY